MLRHKAFALLLKRRQAARQVLPQAVQAGVQLRRQRVCRLRCRLAPQPGGDQPQSCSQQARLLARRVCCPVVDDVQQRAQPTGGQESAQIGKVQQRRGARAGASCRKLSTQGVEHQWGITLAGYRVCDCSRPGGTRRWRGVLRVAVA